MSAEDIFSTVILDHYRHPRGYGKIQSPDIEMDGANPLCGDEIHIQVQIEDDKVVDVGFTAQACAICKASTSMFVEQAKGAAISDLMAQRERVKKMLEGVELTKDDRKALKDFLALGGVSKLPMRVKCAMLVWETWALMMKRFSMDQIAV